MGSFRDPGRDPEGVSVVIWIPLGVPEGTRRAYLWQFGLLEGSRKGPGAYICGIGNSWTTLNEPERAEVERPNRTLHALVNIPTGRQREADPGGEGRVGLLRNTFAYLYVYSMSTLCLLHV